MHCASSWTPHTFNRQPVSMQNDATKPIVSVHQFKIYTASNCSSNWSCKLNLPINVNEYEGHKADIQYIPIQLIVYCNLSILCGHFINIGSFVMRYGTN